LSQNLVKDLYGVADKDREKATTVVQSVRGIVEEKVGFHGSYCWCEKPGAIGKKARRAARVSQRSSGGT
jgi:hypothetical protein